MENLTKRVVDKFGNLTSLSGGTEEPAEPTTPARFEQYEFVFEHGCFTASTAPEDDTLVLAEQRMTLPHVTVLTESEPWSAAVGSGVLWVWLLQNHNGYRDGGCDDARMTDAELWDLMDEHETRTGEGTPTLGRPHG